MIRKLLCLSILLLVHPAMASAAWTPVLQKMQDDRWAPAAAVLADQHSAVIAGGYSFQRARCVTSIDLFNESADTISPSAANLSVARDFATATLLPGGDVLIAGGFNDDRGSLDSAELYEPEKDCDKTLRAHMSVARELFTATLLGDGRVFLAAGFNTHLGHTLNTAELYDPRRRRFTACAGLLQTDRFGQAAVRLADGRVLLVGGTQWKEGTPSRPLASAEIYDPATDRFHRTASDMAFPRDRPTATLLAGGDVLIAGGQDGPDAPAELELFDPATERFSLLSVRLITPRMAHGAVTLPGGRVLLAGGWSPARQTTLASTEIFDPVSLTVSPGPDMPESGHDQALLAFPDGCVLVAGGKKVVASRVSAVDTAAVYRP